MLDLNHEKDDSPASVVSRRMNSSQETSFLSKNNNSHSYLLVKNLKQEQNRQLLENTFKQFDGFEEIIQIQNCSNVYIKFNDFKNVQKIIDLGKKGNSYLSQFTLCPVNKLPLDLNSASKIVIITVYQEKIDINAFTVYEIFQHFGQINKVVIFKKKNYQIFMEFEYTEDALNFKKSVHNTNHQGYFFLKIQFTQKKSLIVKGNSIMEHDFNVDRQNQLNPIHIDTQIQEININKNCPKQTKIIVNSLQDLKTENTTPKQSYFHNFSTHKSVLQISSINTTVKSEQLFNLYSIYGKITKILFNKKKTKAFIQFEKEDACSQAKRLTEEFEIFGNNQKMRIITPKELSELDLIYHPTERVKYDHKIITPYCLRKCVFFPNKTLIISNHISLEKIQALFELFETIAEIFYLNKKSDEDIVIVFESIESSARILSYFRNFNFYGETLNIGFANEDLVQAGMDRRRSVFISVPNLDFLPQNHFNLGRFMNPSDFKFDQIPQNFQMF